MDILTTIQELKKLHDSSLAHVSINSAKPDIRHLLDAVQDAVSTNEVSDVIETSVNAIIDISWEECNVGHWSSVPETPKAVYAYASFLKVILCLLKAANDSDRRSIFLNEAIGAADLGLMLGKGYERQLTQAATKITSLISQINADEATSKIDANATSFQQCSSLTEVLKPEISENFLTESPNSIPIDRLHCPSLEEFNVKHFSPRTPVILSGCINHWPAMTRWNDLNYLLHTAGPRTVPIEIGSSYTQKDWGMELSSLQDFITKHILQRQTKVGYLAQHQLFDQNYSLNELGNQLSSESCESGPVKGCAMRALLDGNIGYCCEKIPELRKDIVIPDYCCLTDTEDGDCDVDINAWFGPAHTLTPLHHDPKHNLLCQVVGAKRIILFSPRDSEFLYPHNESLLDNTARVDPYHPDHVKFPKFEKAVAHYCTLRSGEMLYIPPKWWHHVVSLDVSFSVSFWWE